MADSLYTIKKNMREEMRAKLGRILDHDRTEAGQKASALIRQHFIYRRARVVMVYMALPGEPSLDACIRWAWDDGKTIALPRVSGRDLKAHRIDNVERDVIRGSWNVPEPRESCPLVLHEKLDLVLVPGLAFDRFGWRLGRGHGFYDRFLGSLPDTVYSIGICFKSQLVDAVPYGPNDSCVREVIAV